MASEYLKQKYKDVKPDEPIVLTKAEKWQNWWYYHKWHVVISVVVLFLVGSFVMDLVRKVEPDYQVAYVGIYPLAPGTEEAMGELFHSLADDRNGDGKIKVQVNSYVINQEDPTAYAIQVSLMGDLTVGSSEIFILDDPWRFQSMYGVLLQEDGTLPEEEDYGRDVLCYAWADCLPLSTAYDLDVPLYIAMRGFYKEEDQAAHADSHILFEAMTSGALPVEKGGSH